MVTKISLISLIKYKKQTWIVPKFQETKNDIHLININQDNIPNNSKQNPNYETINVKICQLN